MTNDYRLKIITDCEKSANTFVYMDGVKIPYLQQFELNIDAGKVVVPVSMVTIPLPIEEPIFEDEDIEAQEKIAEFKNVLEITSNGKTADTFIYLNGTILGSINSVRLYANASEENIELEFTQWQHDKKEELFAEGKSLIQPVTIKDFISYKE